MKRLIYIGIILIMFSCDNASKNNKDVLVQIDDIHLTRSEVVEALPKGISASDSLRLANEYTEQWVKEQLVLQKAKLNVGNDAEIRRLVDDYKNQLLIDNYLRLLVEHKAEITPTKEQIETFYNDHKTQYTLPENLLKGIFIILPLDASNKDELTKMLTDEDINKQDIEAYCLKNAAKVDFFTDKWIAFHDIRKHLPELTKSEKNILQKNKIFEIQDTVFQYIIEINDHKLIGEISPLRYIEDELSEFLLTQNKISYLQRMEKNLYQDAKQKGIIKYNE